MIVKDMCEYKNKCKCKMSPCGIFTKFNVCSIMVIILSRCEEMCHIRIFVLFIRG